MSRFFTEGLFSPMPCGALTFFGFIFTKKTILNIMRIKGVRRESSTARLGEARAFLALPESTFQAPARLYQPTA